MVIAWGSFAPIDSLDCPSRICNAVPPISGNLLRMVAVKDFECMGCPATDLHSGPKLEVAAKMKIP